MITIPTKSFTIDTPDQLVNATQLLQSIKLRLNEVTAEREALTTPILLALEIARAKFRPTENKLKKAVEYIRTAQSHYAVVESLRLTETANALQEGKIDLSEALALTNVPIVKGLTFRTSHRLHIVDASLIPREYLIPNEQLIFTDLKLGKKIEGTSLLEVKTPVNRSI